MTQNSRCWIVKYFNHEEDRYADKRVIEHSIHSDSGAMIRDGIKALTKQGVCSEKAWPYDIAKFDAKPGTGCYKEAAKHKITSYHRILTLDEMRACLAEGFPFVFGFTVYDGFESNRPRERACSTCPKKARG